MTTHENFTKVPNDEEAKLVYGTLNYKYVTTNVEDIYRAFAYAYIRLEEEMKALPSGHKAGRRSVVAKHFYDLTVKQFVSTNPAKRYLSKPRVERAFEENINSYPEDEKRRIEVGLTDFFHVFFNSIWLRNQVTVALSTNTDGSFNMNVISGGPLVKLGEGLEVEEIGEGL